MARRTGHSRFGLNRHVERVFNPSRKDQHWGKRRLARDQRSPKPSRAALNRRLVAERLVALTCDTSLSINSSVGIERLQLGTVIRIDGALIKPRCLICGTRWKSFIPVWSAIHPSINLPTVLIVHLPIILHIYLSESGREYSGNNCGEQRFHVEILQMRPPMLNRCSCAPSFRQSAIARL